MERDALEGQVNICTQKGIMFDGPNGIKSMKLFDAFSIFKKIPGTPKFWQQKRSNLLAMINVLGPFQWFFTFSCAELRWPQIIAAILRKRGHIVKILDDHISKENVGMKLKNYLYRVEFQNRLAPHIYGCAWMKDDEIEP